MRQSSSPSEITRGSIEMAVAMAVSGTIGWFVLRAGLPAYDVVLWRCVFALAALGLYCLASGALRRRLSALEWLIAIGGGVAIVLNWIMIFAAIPLLSVAVATAVYNVQPFLLLAFGAVFFGERITAAKVGWLALAFAGILLIASEKPNAGYVQGSFALGIVLALGAAGCWAIAATATKRLAGVPPQFITLIHVAIGIVMLAPFIDPTQTPGAIETWAILACLGIVHTAGTIVLMYAAVQKLPTHLQGILSFLNPVVAVATDVLVLGHALQFRQGAGILLILAAAAGMRLMVRRAERP